MAGTRTAPTVDATPTYVSVTLHLIDAAGDLFTEQMPIDAARTDIEIEAWAAAYQACTNSSLWQITGTSVFNGAKLKTNAVAEYRSGVANGINQVYKQPVIGTTEDQRVVSPIAGIMEGNNDIPLPAATELAALTAATIVLLPTFEIQRTQYTTRRERTNNPVVSA